MDRTWRTVSSGLAVALSGLALTLAGPSSPVSARPAPPRPTYYQAWLNAYPSSQSGPNVVNGTGSSCQLCHEQTNGGDGWNAYGWELRELMYGGLGIDQALQQAEPFDSDADPSGSTNIAEITADTQPGWTDGPNNTIYFADGSTAPNQSPPAGILGSLDPSGVATAFCFGDGTGTPCPCNNPSAPGAGEGCANSSGLGGLLVASGSNSVAADDLVMDASNLLPSQPALLFAGNNAINGGDGVTFGDGLRCAGQSVVRLGVRIPDAGGGATWGPGLRASGGWGSGDVRHFQGWYRDPVGGPCGSGFNLTNGLSVTFAP